MDSSTLDFNRKGQSHRKRRVYLLSAGWLYKRLQEAGEEGVEAFWIIHNKGVADVFHYLQARTRDALVHILVALYGV